MEEEIWFYVVGKKKDRHHCPNITKKEKEYYLKKNRLPSPCDKCYKALLFFSNSSDENLLNFFKLISSIINGFGVAKFNKEVVVFYFRDKDKMLNFIEELKKKVEEFKVKAFVEWRKACKAYQELKPKLWKNSKEFIPDKEKGGGGK